MKKRLTVFFIIGWLFLLTGIASGATEGPSNNFFGDDAGYSNTTGVYNSFFGASAGYSNTSGYHNSFLGRNSGYSNTTGNYNSFLGYAAGYNTTSSNNSFFGTEAGYSNTTGYDNSFLGYRSGYNNTTGIYNTFLGKEAGRYNTTGTGNTYVGYYAGFLSNGSLNVFIGQGAGAENSGGGNVIIGRYAGFESVGSNNVFLGYNAGYYETGSSRLYISNSSTSTPLIYGEFVNQYLEVNGTLNVQGTDAYNSFQLKTLGHTGGSSHAQIVTDLFNSRFTFMSSEATDYAPRVQMIGPQDDQTAFRGWLLFDYGSNIYDLPDAQFNIRHYNTGGPVYMMRVYGRDTVSFPTGNVGIGTTTPTHLIELAGGAYSNGSTWVNASSRELKKNIKEVSAEEAIETVEKLKPVVFNYKEGDQDLHVGFIAEDVPELVANADRKGLESMDIVAVLTKVVQEQQRTMQAQLQMIQELVRKVGQLETALQFKQDKDTNLAQAN